MLKSIRILNNETHEPTVYSVRKSQSGWRHPSEIGYGTIKMVFIMVRTDRVHKIVTARLGAYISNLASVKVKSIVSKFK